MSCKYIVYRMGPLTEETMIIFPAIITHFDIARSLDVIENIISAGMIKNFGSGPQCYGESITLHTRSRKEDQILLNFMLMRE